MTWVCKQHGKACQSYVVGMCEELNLAGVKTIAEAKKFYGKKNEAFVKCIKWEKV
jgi:hypothetical protein